MRWLPQSLFGRLALILFGIALMLGFAAGLFVGRW